LLFPYDYSFFANFNPYVPHPRCTHATEEIIGMGGERKKTLLFNGYAQEVAGLYSGVTGERLFM